MLGRTASAVLLGTSLVTAQQRPATELALLRAFPGCEVERTMRTLDDGQRARATADAGSAIERALVHPYVVTRAGKLVGTAYFDAHRVRTKRETLMVVIDFERKIERIEVLAFAEPPQYQAAPTFYRQFVGLALDDQLNLKRGVDGITGATLTVRAAVRCAREVLATHAVITPRAVPPPSPAAESKPSAPTQPSRELPASRPSPASRPTRSRVEVHKT